MKLRSFEWDDNNFYHAVRHGISKEEIEEVILGADLIRQGASSVYVAYGRSLDGRYIIAIFQYKGQGIARPFSARPMTNREKKRLRRRNR